VLKKRIIPVQLLLEGRLVKTKRFGEWRDVGDPVKSSAVYNSQFADELIFLNISRGVRTVEDMRPLIEAVSKVSFMPMAMGGGINSAEDAAFLILYGADKVVMNSCCYRRPQVITETAERFGAQAVVVCVDARYDDGADDYHLYSECGRRREFVSLEEHVGSCEQAGAGEIMIKAIDCEGTMKGFDIALTKRVMSCTSLPVIAAGGSGNYDHLRQVFIETGVSAVACGSLFNFSDSNPLRAKAFLSNYDLHFKVV
jgi:cyclase